ncbi:MAG TPA: sel1 repeat family protein [Gammaproteobacteria bacterium]|nr:sel1 repeat family protein [Gammaproteobacteria bacterium]
MKKRQRFSFNFKWLLILFLLSMVSACTSSLVITSELQQGKRYFEAGYYKRAMHDLLPLAVNGNAEAQYAVGYMYYYGNGVAQNTDTGHFWIKRAANQHYTPAIKALKLINKLLSTS